MLDYIIVGSGLAGLSFAEYAFRNQKSILVYDNNSQNSSKIAGGLYNPVILKRFSEVWNAQQQLHVMNEFYSIIEKKLEQQFDFKTPILRKFYSVEEQNNWFLAADKKGLEPFLSTNLIYKNVNGIDAPFGYGEVLQTGYVDTAFLLESFCSYLKKQDVFIPECFDYSEVDQDQDGVSYKGLKARHIVYAEGFGLHANPYFNYLPLDGTKGELFIIRAVDLDLDVIINTSVFILPLGNDLFKVGATYNWREKDDLPTEDGKIELIDRIKEILACDFTIEAHFAGVRPTVKDRRPLIGTHPEYKRFHVLNGLGARGVMLGPAMAQELYNHIEHQKILDSVIDIKRYESKYYS
jgi:glycine/D-amino acid oxidase-like deaminating enzyme